MPERQVAEGDPMDISAPLPLDIADTMTERELAAEAEARRSRDPQLPAA